MSRAYVVRSERTGRPGTLPRNSVIPKPLRLRIPSLIQAAPQSAPAAPAQRRTVTPQSATGSQRRLAWIAATAMRLLARTLRYRSTGGSGIPDFPDGPVIFTLWHNRLFLSMKVFDVIRRRQPEARLAALASASKDGAFLSRILQNFGVQPVRGSSSRRGPQALLELTSWAEKGYHLAVTPDGPRGPCYTVHDGIIALAQITGMPIIPYSCHLPWKIRVKSWDRFQIPLPFSSCSMTFGTPIRVPRLATDAERTEIRDQLREVLLAGTQGE